jgi:hypothetical protein
VPGTELINMKQLRVLSTPSGLGPAALLAAKKWLALFAKAVTVYTVSNRSKRIECTVALA